MLRRVISLGLVVVLLAAACGSDDGDTETGTEAEDATSEEATATEEATETEEPTDAEEPTATEDSTETTEVPTPEEDEWAEWADVTGPMHGVTDTSVKVGFTYVDFEALNESIGGTYNFGDVEGAYQALVDEVNANGGIHGRQIEHVIVPVNPVNPIGAEEACVRLTEDEEVFIAAGFWFRDSVTCPIDLGATATIGGEQTPERLALAKAPWVAWDPDTELPQEVIRTFGEEGLLDGSVAVFVTAGDAALMEDAVLPALMEIGVEPVATAVVAASPDDVAAREAEVQLIAQNFEAAGADTVILVGADAVIWPRYMQDVPSYRPQLLFQDFRAGEALTEVTDAASETLAGAISGGVYGPDQAQFEEQTMQDCIAILEAAGVEVPPPSETPPDDTNNSPYTAAFFSCKDLALLTALLQAAGPNLNYGTLELAIEEGFEVTIPGDPTPRTYGPPPASDGDPAAYLFIWDDASRSFVRMEG